MTGRTSLGGFRYFPIIFGVAFILATLFTLRTPGQSSNPGLSFDPISTPAATPPQTNAVSESTPALTLIGLVAGHWQNDSGSVCNDGLQEVEVNLNIATLVQQILTERGYTVQLLQEFDPRLNGYKAIALVSIHADSCEFVNNLATGFKVAAALGTKRPDRAARLTACLRDRYGISTSLPVHSTSVTIDMTSYHAFGEIDENTPAAIIETGFLNLDRQFLTQTPELAAQGIADGIVCFIENESIPFLQPTTEPQP